MSTLLIISGASKGIGRALSVAFMKNTKIITDSSSSEVVVRALLLSRSSQDLSQTQQLMQEEAEKRSITLNVSCHPIDLADKTSLKEDLKDILDKATLAPSHENKIQYKKAIFINNAGSTDPIGSITDMTPDCLDEMDRHIFFNVTSSLWFTSQFTRLFSLPSDGAAGDETLHDNNSYSCTIVNMSSLCAIQPFKTMGVYCAGKAARDMFHATLAAEQKENTHFKVLSYAPGPCQTEMTDHMISTATFDADLNQYFTKAKGERTLVAPEDTAQCLVNIVLSGDFESGAHVDYYDVCK